MSRVRPCQRLGGASAPRGFKQLAARLPVTNPFDRDQPYRCVPMTRENYLIASFGTADQFGQLSFGIANGDLHALFLSS